MRFRKIHLLILILIAFSCGERYEKTNNNEWIWVLHSEAGKHIREMDTDHLTFEVLDNPEYAKDKSAVYWRGIKIRKADPETFEVISENGYSKDKYHVFLENEIIIFADPETFKIFEWPYAKDDKWLFNGTLPIELEDLSDFKITKRSGAKNSTLKSYFIERNDDYKWLDTIQVHGVIYGDDAEAKTKTAKIKGFRRIE